MSTKTISNLDIALDLALIGFAATALWAVARAKTGLKAALIAWWASP